MAFAARNIAMSASAVGARWSAALDLLRQAPTIDVVSTGSALHALDRGSKWELALAFFAMFRRSGLQGDAICRGAAISACEKGAVWESALHILGLDDSQSPGPSTAACGAAFAACSAAARWEHCMALLQYLQLKSLEADSACYGASIVSCKRAAEWRLALHLMQEAKSRGQSLDAACYMAGSRACEQVSQLLPALGLLSASVLVMRTCIAAGATNVLALAEQEVAISAHRLHGRAVDCGLLLAFQRSVCRQAHETFESMRARELHRKQTSGRTDMLLLASLSDLGLPFTRDAIECGRQVLLGTRASAVAVT